MSRKRKSPHYTPLQLRAAILHPDFPLNPGDHLHHVHRRDVDIVVTDYATFLYCGSEYPSLTSLDKSISHNASGWSRITAYDSVAGWIPIRYFMQSHYKKMGIPYRVWSSPPKLYDYMSRLVGQNKMGAHPDLVPLSRKEWGTTYG